VSKKIDLEKEFKNIIGQDCCNDYEFISYDEEKREITYKHLVCGKIVKKNKYKFLYSPSCNNKECVNKKIKQNYLKKYGVEHPLQLLEFQEKRIKTCREKYGVDSVMQSDMIKEKTKKTSLEKYGVESPNQAESVKDKKKKNNLEKYGVEFTLQLKEIRERGREVSLERYGVENPSQAEEIKQKKIDTCRKNYGVDYHWQAKEVKEKIKQTCLEKYGCEAAFQNSKVKEKIKQTNLIKYGVENAFQAEAAKEKFKKTLLDRYGVEHPSQIEEVKNKKIETCRKNYNVDSPLQSSIIQKRIYKTKKINNSFSSSRAEKKLKEYFLKIDSSLIFQYKDEKRYPFNCDFYLPKYDLFIEYQGCWTHGREIFNENNPNHLKKLEKWKNKSQEINFKNEKKTFYNSAVYIWTENDPLKRKIAKENNLNFLEIFSFKDENDVLKLLEKFTYLK